MPGFELQAFREMPKSDAPIIFSLSPITTGIYELFISAGSDLLVTGCSSHKVNSFSKHLQRCSVSRCSIISCGRLVVIKLTLASHIKVAAKG